MNSLVVPLKDYMVASDTGVLADVNDRSREFWQAVVDCSRHSASLSRSHGDISIPYA